MIDTEVLDEPVMTETAVAIADRKDFEKPARALSDGAPSLFSKIRESIFPKGFGKANRAILFTSVDPGVGVSFLASSIVAELATNGQKILLADAEAIAALGGVGLSRGVLSFCEPVGAREAYVLRRRGSPPDEGFSGASAVAIVTALRDEFPYIVIDAPAMSQSRTALLFAAAVDGIVLVAEAGKTETRQLASACRKLQSLGGRVFGLILNTHASEEEGR